jgi:uncharacterized membrane protein
MLPAMPNWSYIACNSLYHLGLALWIGGAVALGALTAPALFRALPRPEAGAIFGPTLRRFARLRVGAMVMILLGAGAKYLFWEGHASSPWLAIRWAAIAFMAFSLIYEIGFQEGAMARAHAAGDTARFGVLHHRAEAMMKVSLVAALLALILS